VKALVYKIGRDEGFHQRTDPYQEKRVPTNRALMRMKRHSANTMLGPRIGRLNL
jgi:hypothetical protein